MHLQVVQFVGFSSLQIDELFLVAEYGEQKTPTLARTFIEAYKEFTAPSLTLELPHPEGTVLLGPISGTVANLMRKGGPRSRRSFPRVK